jgi:hypothetical protein
MLEKNGVLVEIQRMSIEEKVTKLSEVDKAYVRGYIERAVLEYLKQKQRHQCEPLPDKRKM